MLAGFRSSLICSEVYSPADAQTVAQWVLENVDTTRYKKTEFLEAPAAFDIEASSFYSSGKKAACMYVWVLGVYGKVILGRTWAEFVETCETISLELRLSSERRLIIYVHNLDYDFQFFRKWLCWDKVFSIEERKPLYAISDLGIEFRCSYKLSGYSLETVGENLKHYEVKKLVGNLDYSIPRHPKTVLPESEIDYVVNDCKVVMAFIAECIEEEGSITKIPLTKTGYVRRFVRNRCFGESKESRKDFTTFIRSLRITPDEYYQLKRAFQGGFTHASPFYVNQTVGKSGSRDFTSSYPATIVAEKFPMSSSQIVPIRTMKQFEYNLTHYCCLFDVEFTDIESTFLFDNYISSSRCSGLKNEVVANGRIVKASHLVTTITEQDYFIIRKCYRWKGNPRIGIFRRYRKEYLPTPFVNAVLDLYQDKTELKGVAEREEEYNRIKEMINSCFGMCVTDPIRELIPYVDNKWKTERKEEIEEDRKEKYSPDKIKDAIYQYNNSWSRFLFYPWGVWITAYARRNLWTGIFELGSDYMYSDTDSVKARNIEKHSGYFNRYNTVITEEIKKACEYHGIDSKKACPKTIKGVEKPLGVWDFDGEYSRFKTLGAKRYMVEYSDCPENGKDAGKIKLTVAGVNKSKAVPFLKEEFGARIFEGFSNNLTIPPEYTGKLTHTYIDTEISCVLVDVNGVRYNIHELSVVHMEPSAYSLTMSSAFLAYVEGVRIGYI